MPLPQTAQPNPPDAQCSTAWLAPEAAVRRAISEGRRELLAYLAPTRQPRRRSEVLQVFALRALQRSGGLHDVERLRGWLARVLATSIADFQRGTVQTRRREVAFDDDDPHHSGVAPTTNDDQAVCGCLHKMLPTIKPEYAEIVLRADLRGESRDQIAAELGTTANNVAVRLHRGRLALKKRLEQTCMSCPEHGFFYCQCGAGR